MSLVREILYILHDYPGGYRLLYDIVQDINSKNDGHSKKLNRTISSTLSRLKNKGLVSSKNRKWSISPEGKEFLQSYKPSVKHFFPEKRGSQKKTKKETILVFDIPENKRKYRDWLRIELVGLGFEMIQKSVWFGPALPREFLRYLGETDLLEYIRFFKATEKDLI